MVPGAGRPNARGRTLGTIGAAAALIGLALSGCSVTKTPLEAALGDASSAAGAAQLATKGLESRELTRAVAETALEDAVRRVSIASRDVAEFHTDAAREQAVQRQAIRAIARTVQHLHEAQDDVAEHASLDSAADVLGRDRHHLEQCSKRAGEFR